MTTTTNAAHTADVSNHNVGKEQLPLNSGTERPQLELCYIVEFIDDGDGGGYLYHGRLVRCPNEAERFSCFNDAHYAGADYAKDVYERTGRMPRFRTLECYYDDANDRIYDEYKQLMDGEWEYDMYGHRDI